MAIRAVAGVAGLAAGCTALLVLPVFIFLFVFALVRGGWQAVGVFLVVTAVLWFAFLHLPFLWLRDAWREGRRARARAMGEPDDI